MRIRIPLSLFNIFRKEKVGYASPFKQVVAVAAVAAEGLEPDEAFAMRGKCLASGALRFDILKPGHYLAVFSGHGEGPDRARAFAEGLEALGRERAIPSFGVSVKSGEALVGPDGRYVGNAVAEVLEAAGKVAGTGQSRAGSPE